MDITRKIPKLTIKLSRQTLIITGLLLCSALYGFLPQIFLNVAVLGLCVALFIRGEIYLFFPFLLFYGNVYGSIFGLSVQRVYLLLVLFSMVPTWINNMRIGVRYVIPVVIYAIYEVVVMSDYGIQSAVTSFLNILCCVIIVAFYLSGNPNNVRRFFGVYILVALVAYVTGIMGGNTLVQTQELGTVKISRFMATFEDPNYMGFFYTIAVFATVTLKLFSPMANRVIVILLNIMILSSISMTAIVVNVVLWIAYLSMTGKINAKVCIRCLLVIFVCVALYQYGLINTEAPFLGDFSYRVQQKLGEFSSGDLDSVTTGRTVLAAAHFAYFMELPLWKKMLGGTAVNASFISREVYGAAHNEYIDMLLNIGVIGTAAMLGILFRGTYLHYRRYRQTGDRAYLCALMCKGVWIAYAFTLTLFMDYRFMLPFFI